MQRGQLPDENVFGTESIVDGDDTLLFYLGGLFVQVTLRAIPQQDLLRQDTPDVLSTVSLVSILSDDDVHSKQACGFPTPMHLRGASEIVNSLKHLIHS